MDTKKIISRSRYKLYIGNEVTEKLFLKTHNVDFAAYPDAAQVSIETKLSWFRRNPETHVVFYDEAAQRVLGYLAVYPVKPSFAIKYIKGKVDFANIKPASICKFKNNKRYYLYGWSCAILPEYQGSPIKDLFTTSPYNGVKIFRILNEGFVTLLCRLASRGIFIDKMFGEGYTQKGDNYMKELTLARMYGSKKSNASIFIGRFDVDAYSKCRNYRDLQIAYSGK